MKRTLFGFLALMAVCGTAFVGCKKDNALDDTKYGTIITVKSLAGKTHYSIGSVVWDEGDQISVIRGNSGEGNTFSTFDLIWPIVNDEARFGGNLSANALAGRSYYAIYPAQENLSVNNGKLTCEAVKTTQTLTPGTFGRGCNTAVGANDTTVMRFYNVGALAKMSVAGDVNIKSIRITNTELNGAPLSGRGTVNVLAAPNLSIVWDEASSENYVEAVAPNVTSGVGINGGAWFYIVLPACTLHDYIVTITDINGNNHVFGFHNVDLNIERSHVVNLGSFEVKEADVPAFTINSNGKRVVFAHGNLRWSEAKGWRFAEHDYDYLGRANCDTNMDCFGWSSDGNYGRTIWNGYRNENNTWIEGYEGYSGTFVDWGNISDLGEGWRSLDTAEMRYLFFKRSNKVTFNNEDKGQILYTKATVSDIRGVILFPDGDVELTVNNNNLGYEDNSFSTYIYTAAEWEIFKAAGCVFLPVGGYVSYGSFRSYAYGFYWTSIPAAEDASKAYMLYIWTTGNSTNITTNHLDSRFFGNSVRLVKEL